MRDEGLLKAVIERWGTPPQYYRELHRFLDTHMHHAAVVEFDAESGVPVRAVYPFPPLQVLQEYHALLKAMMESTRGKKDEG